MNDYPLVKEDCALGSNQESQRDRLIRLRQNLASRIEDIDLALALLTKNPEIEQLTDLLRRI